jgi:hypothetical protein
MIREMGEDIANSLKKLMDVTARSLVVLKRQSKDSGAMGSTEAALNP